MIAAAWQDAVAYLSNLSKVRNHIKNEIIDSNIARQTLCVSHSELQCVPKVSNTTSLMSSSYGSSYATKSLVGDRAAARK